MTRNILPSTVHTFAVKKYKTIESNEALGNINTTNIRILIQVLVLVLISEYVLILIYFSQVVIECVLILKY